MRRHASAGVRPHARAERAPHSPRRVPPSRAWRAAGPPPRPLASPLPPRPPPPRPPVPGSQVPRCPTARPARLPGLRNCSRTACSRPCGILSPNLKLTDGWLLGGPHVWSSSREKPQVQPSKSINKLISKYCCLPSRTGTPGRTDFKSTPDGHRACGEPGHLSGWKFQSSPPWPPGLEERLGAAAGRELSRTEAATEESPRCSLSSPSSPVAPMGPLSPAERDARAQLAAALIWSHGR